MKFTAVLQLHGKTATGIEVPPEIIEALGAGKKPAVSIMIKQHTYRSSIASMGGKFMLPVSAEHREAAGVKAGDTLNIQIELDSQPREVNVPPDFKKAIEKDKEAKKFFEGLSYSNKLRHVLAIDQAKTPETRQRRIEKSVALFRDGRS